MDELAFKADLQRVNFGQMEMKEETSSGGGKH
jgi:hypothetical protein